jgi:hypothetical protein
MRRDRYPLILKNNEKMNWEGRGNDVASRLRAGMRVSLTQQTWKDGEGRWPLVTRMTLVPSRHG